MSKKNKDFLMAVDAREKEIVMSQAIDNKSEIPEAALYVCGICKFLSGWGPAEDLDTWVVFPCKDHHEAEKVLANVRSREDFMEVDYYTGAGVENILQRPDVLVFLSDRDSAWYELVKR